MDIPTTEPLTPGARKWNATYAALFAFVRDNGRFPKVAENSNLREWMKYQLVPRNPRMQAIQEERLAMLDATLPGWREVRNNRTSESTAQSLVAWVKENNRYPEIEADADEKRLAEWLKATRTNYTREGSTERQLTIFDYLNANLPGWEVRPDAWGIRWEKNLANFFGWVEANDGFPSRYGDSEEQRLAEWMHSIRTQHNQGSLDPARAATLDELTPGWSETPIRHALTEATVQSRNGEWNTECDGFIAWVRENGRFPSRDRNAMDKESVEYQWEIWRMRQTHVPASHIDKEIYERRVARLDTELPGWQGKKRRAYRSFRQGADEFIAWVETNGRLPKYQAPDPEENRQNFWMTSVRTATKGGGTMKVSEDDAAYLDAHVPNWRGRGKTVGKTNDNSGSLAEFRSSK
jgi:hypothetical protein